MQNTEFLNSELTEYSILVIIKKLCAVIVDSEASISDERKVKYLHRLASYQIKGEEGKAILQCYHVLTHTDIRYLLCFAIGMEYGDIQTLFHIERKTIYSVRYRIRKKLKKAGRSNVVAPLTG